MLLTSSLSLYNHTKISQEEGKVKPAEQEVCTVFVSEYSLVHCPIVFSAGALIFGCTVALCFLIRDLMFYVIGESCVRLLVLGFGPIRLVRAETAGPGAAAT